MEAQEKKVLIWRVSNYQKKYLEGILSLFKTNYPDSNLWKKEFFNWQNFKNPAGDSVIKLAINKSEEVVGFYCVAPQTYLINGKKIIGSISLNTLVREDYRGMGIFTTLAKDCYKECLSKKIMFTLGFPNQNSYHGFIKNLGFADLGEMPLLLRPYKISNLLASKLKTESLKNVFKPIDWCLSFGLKNLNEKEKCCFVVSDISRIENKNINRVLREKKFIEWRTGCPGKDYRIVYSKYKNKIDGYMVLGKMESESIKSGLVIDLVVSDNDRRDEIVKSLGRQANEYWKSIDVDQVGCLLSGKSAEYDLLRKNGYLKCPDFLKPQPMRPVIKWHGDVVPEGFYNLKNWYITMIDYDVA